MQQLSETKASAISPFSRTLSLCILALTPFQKSKKRSVGSGPASIRRYRDGNLARETPPKKFASSPPPLQLCTSALPNITTIFGTSLSRLDNMVRADQGIRGRSAPRSKNRSSVTSTIRARSAGTDAANVAAPPPTQITKAAKRAMKRAELMSKVNPAGKASLLNLKPKNSALSKSSLRRQKRKQKEQLAGNTTGLKDLAEAMDEVAQQFEDDESAEELDDGEDEDDDMGAYSARSGRPSSTHPLMGAQRSRKDATVTEKARKAAL